MMGDIIPTVANDRRLQVYKQAVGVVGCITPWKFSQRNDHQKSSPGHGRRLHGCNKSPTRALPCLHWPFANSRNVPGIPAGVLNVVVGSDAQAIGEVLTTA